MQIKIPRSIIVHPGKFLIGWTIVILVLCATPGEFIPSNNWLELLSFDKFVHAGIFCLLTFFWILYVTNHKKSNLIFYVGVLCCILYGASLEWMQAEFFRNRTADWKDIVANSTGCLLATVLSPKLRHWILFSAPSL